jgi:hypothetical protein
MAGEEREQLRLDYDQTNDLIRALTEVRFKLLAFVPTISGAAIGFLGSRRSAGELLGVGLVGLAATIGILVYEIRNTQIYDYAIHRAQALERRLGLASVFDPQATGGLYTERPGRTVRLFGIGRVGQDRGLAVVYAAAVGGWSYVVAWGLLHALGVASAQKVGGILGLACGVVALLELVRIEVRAGEDAAPGERASASATFR